MSNRKAVGIDLGTTFSAVAHIDAYGKPQIIPNAESERITPSVVLFDGSSAIVGTIAKNNSVAEPEKIVDFVKREMGKSKEQFHREFGGTKYSAEELSALILKKLKSDAEKYLKVPVTDAVITVPAYFNDAERTATITAGRLAGLNVLQIINEPTSAALAYGLDKLDEDQTVFVFDLGGGTFDVTLMRIHQHRLEMVATNGDHRLGGKDWDDILVNHVAEEFDRAHGENPLLDLQSWTRSLCTSSRRTLPLTLPIEIRRALTCCRRTSPLTLLASREPSNFVSETSTLPEIDFAVVIRPPDETCTFPLTVSAETSPVMPVTFRSPLTDLRIRCVPPGAAIVNSVVTLQLRRLLEPRSGYRSRTSARPLPSLMSTRVSESCSFASASSRPRAVRTTSIFASFPEPPLTVMMPAMFETSSVPSEPIRTVRLNLSTAWARLSPPRSRWR